MIAVRDHLDQFGDARIAIVTFATPERLAAYRQHLQLPFDVVTDLDRSVYRLLGAERGSGRQVWSAFRDLPPDTVPEQRDQLRQQTIAKADELRKQTDEQVKAVLDQTQYEAYQQEQDKLRPNQRGGAAGLPAGGGNGRQRGARPSGN